MFSGEHSANDIFSSAAFAVEGLDTYDTLRVQNLLLEAEIAESPRLSSAAEFIGLF
jgi:hypothetical protein